MWALYSLQLTSVSLILNVDTILIAAYVNIFMKLDVSFVPTHLQLV